MEKIEEDYFEWLCNKIVDTNSNVKYSMLTSYLYDHVFVAVMSMDENRSEDGKELRRRFIIEKCDIYTPNNLRSFDDNRQCSMLEMMVALSIRCEETIMVDDKYGDRTGIWFWNMIVSLGLGTMNDSRFDENYVNIILDKFINRQYQRNGKGGLFTIDGIKKDMRTVEIWYQMCWYLDFL